MSVSLANLSLEEEDDEGFEFIIGTGEGGQRKVELCLVCRVLTDKPIHFLSFRDRMASLWRPGKGVTVSEVNKGTYVFQFYHPVDMKRVVDGGPWSFDNNLVVLQVLKVGEDPCQLQMVSTAFWIQVFDIPAGFISEGLGKQLGDFIGEYIDYDPNNNVGAWRTYMRIRVLVDITKPLKRRKKFRKQGGEGTVVTFKYERLPLFCFVCGCLGHGEKFCSLLFDNPDLGVERGWGSWLRAPSRRAAATAGERWLVHPTDPALSSMDTADQGKNQEVVMGELKIRDPSRFQKNISAMHDSRNDSFNHALIAHHTGATSEMAFIRDSNDVAMEEDTSLVVHDDRKRKKYKDGELAACMATSREGVTETNVQILSVEPASQARREQ